MNPLAQLLDNNHPGPNKPDGGLDVLKGLDKAINHHADATNNLATSVKTAVADSQAVGVAWYQGGSMGLVLGLVAGFVIGLLMFKQPQRI